MEYENWIESQFQDKTHKRAGELLTRARIPAVIFLVLLLTGILLWSFIHQNQRRNALQNRFDAALSESKWQEARQLVNTHQPGADWRDERFHEPLAALKTAEEILAFGQHFHEQPEPGTELGRIIEESKGGVDWSSRPNLVTLRRRVPEWVSAWKEFHSRIGQRWDQLEEKTRLAFEGGDLSSADIAQPFRGPLESGLAPLEGLPAKDAALPEIDFLENTRVIILEFAGGGGKPGLVEKARTAEKDEQFEALQKERDDLANRIAALEPVPAAAREPVEALLARISSFDPWKFQTGKKKPAEAPPDTMPDIPPGKVKPAMAPDTKVTTALENLAPTYLVLRRADERYAIILGPEQGTGAIKFSEIVSPLEPSNLMLASGETPVWTPVIGDKIREALNAPPLFTRKQNGHVLEVAVNAMSEFRTRLGSGSYLIRFSGDGEKADFQVLVCAPSAGSYLLDVPASDLLDRSETNPTRRSGSNRESSRIWQRSCREMPTPRTGAWFCASNCRSGTWTI